MSLVTPWGMRKLPKMLPNFQINTYSENHPNNGDFNGIATESEQDLQNTISVITSPVQVPPTAEQPPWRTKKSKVENLTSKNTSSCMQVPCENQTVIESTRTTPPFSPPQAPSATPWGQRKIRNTINTSIRLLDKNPARETCDTDAPQSTGEMNVDLDNNRSNPQQTAKQQFFVAIVRRESETLVATTTPQLTQNQNGDMNEIKSVNSEANIIHHPQTPPTGRRFVEPNKIMQIKNMGNRNSDNYVTTQVRSPESHSQSSLVNPTPSLVNECSELNRHSKTTLETPTLKSVIDLTPTAAEILHPLEILEAKGQSARPESLVNQTFKIPTLRKTPRSSEFSPEGPEESRQGLNNPTPSLVNERQELNRHSKTAVETSTLKSTFETPHTTEPTPSSVQIEIQTQSGDSDSLVNKTFKIPHLRKTPRSSEFSPKTETLTSNSGEGIVETEPILNPTPSHINGFSELRKVSRGVEKQTVKSSVETCTTGTVGISEPQTQSNSPVSLVNNTFKFPTLRKTPRSSELFAEPLKSDSEQGPVDPQSNFANQTPSVGNALPNLESSSSTVNSQTLKSTIELAPTTAKATPSGRISETQSTVNETFQFPKLKKTPRSSEFSPETINSNVEPGSSERRSSLVHPAPSLVNGTLQQHTDSISVAGHRQTLKSSVEFSSTRTETETSISIVETRSGSRDSQIKQTSIMTSSGNIIFPKLKPIPRPVQPEKPTSNEADSADTCQTDQTLEGIFKYQLRHVASAPRPPPPPELPTPPPAFLFIPKLKPIPRPVELEKPTRSEAGTTETCQTGETLEGVKHQLKPVVPVPRPPPPPVEPPPPPPPILFTPDMTKAEKVQVLRRGLRVKPNIRALLREIEQGKQLNHVQCNDRSYPRGAGRVLN